MQQPQRPSTRADAIRALPRATLEAIAIDAYDLAGNAPHKQGAVYACRVPWATIHAMRRRFIDAGIPGTGSDGRAWDLRDWIERIHRETAEKRGS